MPQSFTLLITHTTTQRTRQYTHTYAHIHMHTYICSLRFCIGHSSSFTSCNGWRRQLRLPHRNSYTHSHTDACRLLKTRLSSTHKCTIHYTRGRKCNWKFCKLLKRSTTAATAAVACLPLTPPSLLLLLLLLIGVVAARRTTYTTSL